MAIVHVVGVRNSLADNVVDRVDVGTTNAAGRLVIATAGFAVIIAEIPLNNPAFGAAASGVATADVSPQPEATAIGTGTAAVFRLEDRDEAEIFQGTVTPTGGGGDMEMSSVGVTTGDAVRVNLFTYTAAP